MEEFGCTWLEKSVAFAFRNLFPSLLPLCRSFLSRSGVSSQLQPKVYLGGTQNFPFRLSTALYFVHTRASSNVLPAPCISASDPSYLLANWHWSQGECRHPCKHFLMQWRDWVSLSWESLVGFGWSLSTKYSRGLRAGGTSSSHCKAQGDQIRHPSLQLSLLFLRCYLFANSRRQSILTWRIFWAMLSSIPKEKRKESGVFVKLRKTYFFF